MKGLLVGCFGFLGTLARYGLQGAVQRFSGSTFPYGTLSVNVLGSFAVGLIATLVLERSAFSPTWRTAILGADRRLARLRGRDEGPVSRGGGRRP